MRNASILKELIKGLELSISAFEKKINVGSSVISVAIRRDSKIKEDTIDKIVKTFPRVSRSWLETGEGEMLIKTTPADDDQQGDKKGGKKEFSSENVNQSIVNEEVSIYSQSTKNDEAMMNRILSALADANAASKLYAEGYKLNAEGYARDAEARLLNAQIMDRLTMALGFESPNSKAS